MQTLGVVANCTKERARDVLLRLVRKARELGIALRADADAAALVKGELRAAGGDLADQVDAMLALGGDGTMLRVMRMLEGRDKPVIGVNLGSLGFLTSVTEESLEHALECLAQDRYTTSARSIAECTVVRGKKEISLLRALNDIVVARGAAPRVVTLNVSVGGDRVTSYVCDGLIVATPTGSTGHSLSAGGPILAPETKAFLISLVCPHSLSSRPLVVPDEAEIIVTVEDADGPLLLAADGQIGGSLGVGDRVVIRRSARGVRFIHLPGYSYYDVLRRKLGWRGSSV